MLLSKREQRESGRDYAMRMIKENIIQLEFEPGSMISENELAVQLGLSRTPVREAFIELTEVKIIDVYPQRGTFVSLVDYDLVEQAQFMRETLECAMIERCCVRGIAPDQAIALDGTLRLQELYQSRDAHRFFELDNIFHQQLFSIANLAQVYKLLNRITVHFDRVRALALVAVKENKLVEDHRAIMHAIQEKDAEAARSIMHKHLTRYQLDQQSVRERYPTYIA